MQNFIFQRIDERSDSIKTDSEYHAIKDALSNSRMDYLLHDTPAHYWDALNKPNVQTDAMVFGSAYHCVILEGDEFNSRYCVHPALDGRTKAGKEFAASHSCEGRTAISESNYQLMRNMHAKFTSHKFASDKLQFAAVEQPIVANALLVGGTYTDWFGTVKGKADIVGFDCVADLKTISDLRDATIARAIRDKYARQGAFYLDLFGKEVFYLIFQEKSSPFEIRVIRLNEAQIDYGRAQYELALHRYNAMLAEKAIGHVLAYPQVDELEIWLSGKKTDYTESEAGF